MYQSWGSDNRFHYKTDHEFFLLEYLFSQKSFQQRAVLILHSALYHMDLFRIEALPAQCSGYGWQNQAIYHSYIYLPHIYHSYRYLPDSDFLL